MTPRTRIVDLTPEGLLPEARAVVHSQGVPPGVDISARVGALVDDARRHFLEVARPAGLLVDIDADVFATVFEGEGANAEDPVVGRVYLRADHLALFAITLGEGVTGRIAELFAGNDFAVAAMLDSVASVAADNAVRKCEARWLGDLTGAGLAGPDQRVLAYSPGYCGWHITGQTKVIEAVGANRIGVTLGDSYLMTPLKSVTGVLASGPVETHVFDPGFSYCSWCRDRTCTGRIRALLAEEAS